jgi:hypothetical protein
LTAHAEKLTAQVETSPARSSELTPKDTVARKKQKAAVRLFNVVVPTDDTASKHTPFFKQFPPHFPPVELRFSNGSPPPRVGDTQKAKLKS